MEINLITTLIYFTLVIKHIRVDSLIMVTHQENLELGEQMDVDADIEREEMNLDGLAEDDDFGDRDGDEHY